MSTDAARLVAQNAWKQAAAESVAAQLRDGEIVGLGSGSTATLAVDVIGRRVKEGLKIVGVSTSEKTSDQATRLGIPLATLAEYPHIDVTFDGADEVELGTLNLIKGGGGNLLREKIVASASSRMVVLVDSTKLVERLGKHPVPVEVVPFGFEATGKRLEQLGAKPTLRSNADGTAYLTDGGHYIYDCAFGLISAVEELAAKLDGVVGVVEHGLFIGIASEVRIGGDQGVRVLERSSTL